MPAKRVREQVRRRFYTWVIYQRSNVWYADGRSGNSTNLGRHSLGKLDKAKALAELDQLDLVKAIEYGLASPGEMTRSPGGLPISEGRRLYVEYISRPAIAGGVRKTTVARYKAVFDKFGEFCHQRNVGFWSQVSADTLLQYAKWLEVERGISRVTQGLELTTIKQTVKWLVEQGRLKESSRIVLRIRKPQGTTNYCWREEEIAAMLDRCDSLPKLQWLKDVILFLAYSGMRISELVSLRWADIDVTKRTISLTDEWSSSNPSNSVEARRTKSGRSRVIAMHPEIISIVERLAAKKKQYVFYGPRGGRLKGDTARNYLIRDVLKPLKSEFPTSGRGKGFAEGRLHSFRHFFCSMCVNRGIPEQTVMNWLGHSESKMVRHYYHLGDAEALRQIDKLEIRRNSRKVREG